MNEQIDWERLARYVSGEATDAEVAAVDAWKASDHERQQLVASLERRWRAAAPVASFDVDRAWARMAPQLKSLKEGSVVPLVPNERPQLRSWMFALAAALLLTVGLSYRWMGADDADAPAAVALAGLNAQTAIGERRAIDLPDGSKVVLGVHSTLRFEPAAPKGARIVHLDGEAFFNVQHDATRPFRVLASNVVTEDVGTEFSVRAYPGDARVRVAVREGAVSLFRRDVPGTAQVVLLGQMDVATIAADGVPKVTSDSAVERLFAWQNGDLVFDNASLAEVASELSRWYDVDVRFAEPELAGRHLTSTFKSDPIDDVLRVIGLSAEVRFERKGRLVTAYAAPRTSTGEPLAPRGSRVAERGDGRGGV